MAPFSRVPLSSPAWRGRARDGDPAHHRRLEDVRRDHGGEGLAGVKTFDSGPIPIRALGHGDVDAVISDMTRLDQVLKQSPGKSALVHTVAA